MKLRNILFILRRGILLVSFFIFSTTVLANGYFSGPYVGISGGVIGTEANGDVAASAHFIGKLFDHTLNEFLITDDTYRLFQSPAMAQQSAIGALYVGYGQSLPIENVPLYLGIELFASLADRDVNTINTLNRSDVDEDDFILHLQNNSKIHLRPFEYGVDVRPGWLVTPLTLLYGRVGVALNRISLTVRNDLNIQGVDSNQGVSLNDVLSGESSKNITGLRLGLGVEHFFRNHLAVRADYIYTNYRSVNVQTADTIPDIFTSGTVVPQGYTANAKLNTTSQAVMLGVTYLFDNNPCAFTSQHWDGAYFNGPYLGARAGFTRLEGSFNNQITAAFNDFADPDVYGNGLSTKALGNFAANSIFAGYDKQWQQTPLNIGIEAFANLNANEEVDTSHFMSRDEPRHNILLVTLNNTEKAQLNTFEYGVDIRPGYLLNDRTLLYLRGGVVIHQMAKLETNSKLNLDNTHEEEHAATGSAPDSLTNLKHDIITGFAELPTSTDKTVYAPRFGVGLEEYLGRNFSLNADYIYTNYGKVNVSGVTTIRYDDGSGLIKDGYKSDTTVRLYSQAALLGITYHFL